MLHEADALLIDAGVRHATVELEEIARCWPEAIKGSSRKTFVYQNLAGLWSNFAAVGASQLLLSDLVEQRSELRLVSEAIPGAVVTVVRLQASLSELKQRILRREPASSDDDLAGARWWAQHFEEARVEDHLVETENPAGGRDCSRGASAGRLAPLSCLVDSRRS